MVRRHAACLLSAAVISLMAVPAAACTVCSTAAAHYWFPPLFPMSWVGPLWYFALALLFLPVPKEWRPIGRPVTALVYFAVVSAVSLWGSVSWNVRFTPDPWFMAPFTFFAAAAVVRAWLRRSVIQPRWTLRACAVASVIALTAIAAPSVFLVMERLGQDRVDIIVRYPGTAFAAGVISSLGEKPDTQANELRRVVSEAGGYAGGKAARYLAKASAPAVHVPLILDQLAREEEQARGDETGWGRFCCSYYHEALIAATGLKLPENTTSGVWRARIAELDATKETTPTLAVTD